MKEGRGAGTRRRSQTAKYDPASDAPTQRVESDSALEKRLRAALAPNLLLVRAIGAGGMARVFLARQPALKRLVAVKVLSGDLAADPDARKRFEREAQAVAALSHPNIVAIHAVGELDDGTPYFVMQYVEGRSMAARVEQDGPLSLSETRRVVGEVAAALAAAHRQGIIHRDIKPANILYEESSGRALVSDFGIAAMTASADAKTQTRLTGTGMALGTPQYMSPEQLSGEVVTDRTDIYSLGLLAHELLAGSGPYRGGSAQELIAAHLRDTAPRLSLRRADVDPELDELVARALEKDATKRPSAAEIARRLAPGGAALLEWPPPGLEPLHGRARRVAIPMLVGSLLLLASLLGLMLAGPRLNAAHVSGATLALFLAASAGALAIVIGMRHARLVAAAMARAVRDGYGWTTVLETVCDVRGDTGHLVTASREYAALDARARDRYRRSRLLREVSLIGAGMVAIPLMVAAIVIGPSTVAGLWTLAAAALLPLASVVLAITLAERERTAFAAHRRRTALAADDDRASLARSWNTAFDDTRGAGAIGRGPAAASWLGKLALGGGALLVAASLLVAMPLAVAGVVGPTYWLVVLPEWRPLKTIIRELDVIRPHRLDADPSLSPVVAGDALHALLVATGDTTLTGTQRAGAPRLPLVTWRQRYPAALFKSASGSKQFAGLPDSRQVLPAARRGLSVEELDWLRAIAAAPHWRELGVLARAGAVDHQAVRRADPHTATLDAISFRPAQIGGLRLLAHASTARAAFHLAEGRADSAEHALRELLSAGLLLVDDGATYADHRAGAFMAATARDALIQLYDLTGDARGRQLQGRLAAVRSTQRAVPPGDVFQGADVRDAVALRAALLRTADDPSEPRGIRLTSLWLLAQAPCTNLRELVWGPGPDIADAFDRARSQWARFASDSVLIDLVERGHPVVNPDAVREGPAPWYIARAASAVLRNPRFANCAAMYLRR